jgi:hypothetical protein
VFIRGKWRIGLVWKVYLFYRNDPAALLRRDAGGIWDVGLIVGEAAGAEGYFFNPGGEEFALRGEGFLIGDYGTFVGAEEDGVEVVLGDDLGDIGGGGNPAVPFELAGKGEVDGGGGVVRDSCGRRGGMMAGAAGGEEGGS